MATFKGPVQILEKNFLVPVPHCGLRMKNATETILIWIITIILHYAVSLWPCQLARRKRKIEKQNRESQPPFPMDGFPRS